MKKPQKPPTNPRKVSPQPADSQLGALLRSERESRGWTLEQLAKRLKVTKGYVSRLEGGKARPAVSMIEALAKTLQIDPNPILIVAGHIPADVSAILRSHPVEAPTVLRESFGDSARGDRTGKTHLEVQCFQHLGILASWPVSKALIFLDISRRPLGVTNGHEASHSVEEGHSDRLKGCIYSR